MHLAQKRRPERLRRLRYFAAALEVIRSSRNQPESRQNPAKKIEILHRFSGLTKDKELFYVQVKERKPKGTKQLVSVFPEK